MAYKDPDDERSYQWFYHLIHRGAEAARQREQLKAAKGTGCMEFGCHLAKSFASVSVLQRANVPLSWAV